MGILFLLFGDASLLEDSSSCCSLSSVSKICEGSTFSTAMLFLRPPVREGASEFVVVLRDCVDFRGLRFVGSANSSSLSSFTFDCTCSSSSSDSTTFLRPAVRLEDLVGNADILAMRCGLVVSALGSEVVVPKSRTSEPTRKSMRLKRFPYAKSGLINSRDYYSLIDALSGSAIVSGMVVEFVAVVRDRCK